MSIHVVDVSRGVVAAGMRVEVFQCEPRQLIGGGTIAANGTLPDDRLNTTLLTGAYEAVFHIADYFRDAGVALSAPPFLDIVSYRFGIAFPDQHYHLPMKLTPWGYSCFRGGA
jgi:5-hydroxyisourate hydrolase